MPIKYEVYRWFTQVNQADFPEGTWNDLTVGEITLTPEELGNFLIKHKGYNFMICDGWIAIDTRRFQQR